MRNQLKSHLSKALKQRSIRCDDNGLAHPAIVFAPHQDDETLACGGTIARKRALGVDVRIVFITDGTASHEKFVSEQELRTIRRQEAITAGARLGVSESSIEFLGFPDGNLAANRSAAILSVRDILHRNPAKEVFIPSALEPVSDHALTNQIVLAALAEQAYEAHVHEYPVWYWYHWPWVNLGQKKPRMIAEVMRNTWSARFGFNLVRTFSHVVSVEDVLNEKRQALEAHRSQMIKPPSCQEWPILAEIADGEFLDCFFQPVEIFRRSAFVADQGCTKSLWQR